MSEPSSLYARFAIRPAAYQAFRASPVSAPADFPDWVEWAATRPMHGEPPSAAALAEMRGSGEPTGAVLDQFPKQQSNQTSKAKSNIMQNTYMCCLKQALYNTLIKALITA